MTTPTLLGHLAQFGSFSMQAEVLCTQGLAYLLQTHGEARAAMAEVIRTRTGVEIGDPLTWIAEATQGDRGIPDLEARRRGGIPVAKIEAKLFAALAEGQLRSYVDDLRHRNDGPSAMLLLVPAARTKAIAGETAQALGLSGAGPWPAGGRQAIETAVISWEELFDGLDAGRDGRYRFELEQLQAMYRVLSGGYIAPLASIEELEHWRERETDLHNVVDQATRRLTKGHRLLPFGQEPLEGAGPEVSHRGYHRRYVCPANHGVESCFSIGVRDPFTGFLTPIWLRFHKDTGNFSRIRQRIEESSRQCLVSGGHVWIPLNLPLVAFGEDMIQAVVEQAEEIMQIAYPGE